MGSEHNLAIKLYSKALTTKAPDRFPESGSSPLSTNSARLVKRGTLAKLDFKFGGAYCPWAWEKTGNASPSLLCFWLRAKK